MTYGIKEISFADTGRMFRYKQGEVYGAKLNIKGFNYAWILESRSWQKDDKVLDVGAGYSHLPIHIARELGCETWAVDDFGMNSDDEFWTRGSDPTEFMEEHAEINYVLERLGNPQESSLPENYFDVIYSASALEHVPPEMTVSVWRHMDSLLKPGGELIHALDLRFPTSRGVLSVVKAELIDLIYPLLPISTRIKYSYYTPKAYIRQVFQSINIRKTSIPRDINVFRFVLDPEVVIEPFEATYNRIVKDGMTGKRHLRVGSLLIHLIKE